MNLGKPSATAPNKTSRNGLYRWLPRRLDRQLMLMTALCLVVSILGFGAYTAKKQTDLARETITAQMSALAQNLATVNAYFLIAGDLASIEAIAIQTATVPGIFSVLVTDVSGKPLSEVVNQRGKWSPRFNADRQTVPKDIKPVTQLEVQEPGAASRDFLAGNAGKISAWHPITASGPLGWVRVSYRLDSFDQTAIDIWTQALLVIALAIGSTLFLLAMLLRPPMRALRAATDFASELDHGLGAKITVSTGTAEIEALGHALNVVSERLFAQNNDLNNQKFALDQHAIVSMTDLNGSITYANERFCDISGYSQAELIGQNHRIVKSGFHPPELFEEMWHTISQGEVWNGEVKNRKKDGSFYWVSATIVPFLGADGLSKQYIGIRTDITAIKALEERLREARASAEAATAAKGQFLANMSHEIRTPMNDILGLLQLLQNTDLSKRQQDYTSKTEGAAKSLLGLLNDILDFSKIDAGKMTLDIQPFPLDRLLRDLSVILSANVGQKPVEVLFDIDPATPKTLMGDSMRLQQVLINLGGNAIKFTSKGNVVVHIKVMASTPADTTLQISVLDNGIGIAPENQKHIFDGFSQAEASTTRRFGGTGLGLSICKRLVGLMGGELTLESAPGVGSNFNFTITLPNAVQAPGAHSPMDTTNLGTVSHRHPCAHLRVLVVDDNALAREILTTMGQSLSWQVDVADSGAPALTLVQNRIQAGEPPYQALLVDWQMPDMDGWETIDHLQKIIPKADAPIMVMVTSHSRETLAQRSAHEQAQIHGFLVKPVTASMLMDVVADATSSRRNPRASIQPKAIKQRRLNGLRLLVVEDNLVNQQVAQEMLAAEGAVVELADNGLLGVTAVAQAQTPFDAVLMDIQMPVMDGYTAAIAIRQELGNTDLPIIAMTANAMASDRDACLAAGMNDHVGKPFDLKHLVEVLLSHIQGRAGALPPVAPVRTAVERSQAASDIGLTEALPPPEAIDVEGALERLGDNTELYAAVLEAYLGEIAGMPDQLDALLQSDDQSGAVRLLHTLKGLSGTVGASYLAAVARQAETAVKGAGAHFQHDLLRADFRLAVASTSRIMGQIAQEFTALEAPPPPSAFSSTSDTAVLLGELRELQELLRSSDMRALDVHARLRHALASQAPGQHDSLDNALASFDFVQGVTQCDHLIALLEAKL